MANKSWKTAVDGFWSVSNNWNPSLPTSVDVALINLAGVYTVTLDIDQVLGGLTLGGTASGTQTLAIAGNTLTLNGASTVGNNGVLALNGGTITGTGALTVSGTGKLNWSGGTLSGTGKKTISGALNLSGYQNLDGTTLETSGATIWTGAGYLSGFNNAIWNNTSTGTIDLQGDADFYSFSGTPSFNNAGTLTKSNGVSDGSDESNFNIAFNNTGTVNVKKGTLNLSGGGTNSKTFTVDAGATLKHTSDYTYNTGNSVTGTGNLLLEGGTVTVAAASTWSAPVVLTRATLTGAGALTISNKLTWSGWNISGTGKKTISGALNISGSGLKQLDGTTLETSGATIWTGTGAILSYTNTIWNNTSTGTIDLQSDADLVNQSGGIFNNAGTFTKSNGATDGSDVSYFNIAFNNTGTVNVKKGTLDLAGGGTNTKTFNIALGATLRHYSVDYTYGTGNSVTGTGNLLLEGGTVTVAAASTWSAPVALTGATLTGAGALTISNKLNWSGGTISGTGKKTISGALNLSGSESLDGTTLETSGATIWTGVGYLSAYNSATWNNTSTGTIDLQNDADLSYQSGGVFNNAGTFTKSNGAIDGSNDSIVSFIFNNTGTVNVKKGTLNLAGGGTNTNTFSIDLGATLKHTSNYTYNTGNSVTGTGNLLLEAGTITVAVASTWSAPVVLTGATLTGAGALTISNKLSWSGWTITGTGKKTVSGTLNLSGYQYLDGTTLETSGATIWTGTGTVYGYNGAIWNNTSTGTIDLQGDADFYLYSRTPSFNNAGTFTKSDGATDGNDNSYFTVAFNNTGTVNVNKGKLAFGGGGTNTKTFNIALGATLWHYTGDYIYGTGNSVTGTGDLLLDGGTVTVAAASTWSAPVVLTGANLTGTGALTISNKLTWSGGTLSGTGKKTVSGALNLSGSQILDGTTLETNSATIWTGMGYLQSYNGAIWNNTSTGTIDLQGDADFYFASGTPSGLSIFYLWIKTLETDTSLSCRELPIYRLLGGATFS
jgi:uncharacterized protein with beta-barrel porin domain